MKQRLKKSALNQSYIGISSFAILPSSSGGDSSYRKQSFCQGSPFGQYEELKKRGDKKKSS